MMKKLCLALTLGMLTVGTGVVAQADSISDYDTDIGHAITVDESNVNHVANDLIGVYPKLSKGWNYPTSVWNVATQGRMNMQASSQGGVFLYSNNLMTGKTTYRYYFHNQGHNTINVSIRNQTSHAPYLNIDVASGRVATGTVSLGNAGTRAYVQFYSSRDYVFSGYVE
ncbi:hypothetical protein [Enterococcus faecium]|nr:hypothetical protein [Enterococcus faecium]